MVKRRRGTSRPTMIDGNQTAQPKPGMKAGSTSKITSSTK
jgi:hypothetical protein